MIKAIVISLSKNVNKFNSFRKRFQDFFANNPGIELERLNAHEGELISYKRLISMGYDTHKPWRDPYHNRKFTKGEIGCVLSHIDAWKRCIELNEPVLIFEDDVEFYSNFDLADVVDTLSKHEFVFLSRKEIQNQPVKISEKLVKPSFSYWACGYAITPAAAKKLCSEILYKNLIPTDEYIPVVLGINPHAGLNEKFQAIRGIIEPLAYENNLCGPVNGAFDVSDTEIGGAGTSYFVDFQTHVFTVATDESLAKQLINSCKYHKVSLNTLGSGSEWLGGEMKSGPGGGMKINLLKNAIKNIDDNDVIMFLDGYDVFVNDNLDNIITQYLKFHSKVVFASEKTCWPNKSLAEQFESTANGNNYLNSGCFIGTAIEIKRILEQEIEDSQDDQEYYQLKYLSKQFDIKLDKNNDLFQCVSCDEDFISVLNELKIYNDQNNSYPKIVHGNGGEYSKEKFDHMYYQIYKPDAQYIHRFVCDGIYKEIGPDILLMRFMSKEMCSDIIQLSEHVSKRIGFKPLPGDDYPGQEIRINQMDRELWYAIEDNLQKYVYPAIEKYWHPVKMFGIRDLFVIRYSKDTQKNLNLHNDISYVSGSVKLNCDYEGAQLYFPRQNFYNTDVEVGDLLLWPSQVTHPHESLEIQSGTKYSLVLWTKRSKRDDY